MTNHDSSKAFPLPEKARLLELLKAGRFAVPDFIYVPATDFENKDFDRLEAFLKNHRESFKVIARSAHPMEEFFKGGTFDSVETYADVGGVEYARKRMLRLAETAKLLSIKRQQIFSNAPDIVLDEMGIIVMPFIEGSSVMAKMIGNHWEFGYCRDRVHKVQSEPYITNTPHDIRLLQLSEDIQNHLEFPCEIEYIISADGEIHVVQAKDISSVETLEQKESERSVRLDGVRRIRKRRNYRERRIYVMDTRIFYLNVITTCEDLLHGQDDSGPGIEDVIAVVEAYEAELEAFAMRYQRFGVLGIAIQNPDDLYQIANHYLDEMPELQEQLSKKLSINLYRIDNFLSEADTLIAKDKFRVNLCSHDAYGIDTVRNPMWNVYWSLDRHEEVVAQFLSFGFKTGDTIGIDINEEDKPIVFRL
jgi:hypothetical protein